MNAWEQEDQERLEQERAGIKDDPLLKDDYEGPRVLVSFVWPPYSQSVISALFDRERVNFKNVIVNTGMPKTNRELDIIKMAAANWDLGRSSFKYDNYEKTKAGGRLPNVFIIAIKEV